MANSRDVNLRIKAQDDASRVLKGIKQAFADTAKQIDQSGKSTGNANKAYSNLGKEVSSLATAIDRAKGKIDFSKQLDAVSTAARRVSSDFDESKGKLSQYAAAHDLAKNSVASMRKELEAQKDAHGKTKTELSAASGAVSKYGASLERAEKNVSKYTKQIALAETKAEGLRSKLGQLKTEQDKLNSSDNHAAKVAENLKRRIDELRRAREEERKVAIPRVSQKAGVSAEARQGMLDTKAGNLGLYDRQIADVQAQLDALAAGRARAAEPLAKINERVKGLESEIKATENLATARKRLETATGKRNEAQAGLTAARAEQERLSAAVAQSDATIRRMGEAMTMAAQDANKMGLEKSRLAAETDKLASKAAKATAELERMESAGGSGAGVANVERMTRQLERQEARLRAIADLYERQARYSDGAGGAAPSQYASQMRGMNEQLRRAQADAEAFRAKMKEIGREAMGMRMNPRIRGELREMQMYLNAADADARQLRMQLQRVGHEAASAGQNKLQAWKTANNESRTALSLYQRLRGQVLSLIGAYVGLFGVISAVQGVTQAFMQQEAALSRLGVVHQGNMQRMQSDMDWLRREAGRLGIEFGTLADQYTKFAVAANMSNFSEAGTKQIFTSVSEAARVNKLSLEEIKGVYLALQQMISKGKISAEELRQQLGERLPGAMNLMAEAFGVSVSELDDMMKKGKALATEENMLKFADILNEKFGSQLPAALRTFTTELGRLQNSIFNAKVTVGKGGLIDSLTEVMRNLNEWAQSKEAVQLFLEIGHAMGQMASVIPSLVKNMDTLFLTVKALIALAATRWILGLGSSIVSFTRWTFGAITGLNGMSAAMTTVQTRAGVMGLAMARATGIVRALRLALMSLGPLAIGIGVASALTYALGDWSDGVDKITSSTAEHERIMDQILSKYEEAKGKTYDWKTAIDAKNRAELAGSIDGSLEGFQAQADKTTRSARGSLIAYSTRPDVLAQINIPVETKRRYLAAIADINNDATALNKKTLGEFKAVFDTVAKSIGDPKVKGAILDLSKNVEGLGASGQRVSDAMFTAKELGHAVNDTNGMLDKFPTTFDGITGSASKMNAELDKTEKAFKENFIDVIQKAMEEVIDFKDDLREADLAKAMKDPFTGANTTIGEMLTLMAALRADTPELAKTFKDLGGDDVLGAIERLRQKLGSLPGFGGIMQAMFGAGAGPGGTGPGVAPNGSMLSTAMQYNGLNEKSNKESLKELFGSAGLKIDPEITAWCAAFVNAVLSKNGIKGSANALGARSFLDWGEEVAQDKAQVGDIIVLRRDNSDTKGHVGFYQGTDAKGNPIVFGGNQSNAVNSQSYRKEDILGFRRAPTSAEQTVATMRELTEREEKAAEAAKKKAEEDAKASERKKRDMADLDRELVVAGMIRDGKDKEAYIMEKIAQFQEANKNATKEEIEAQKAKMGQLWEIENSHKKSQAAKEAEKKHQEEINNLETQRSALLSQREMATTSGDTKKVGEIDLKLVDVNAQLDAAITKFIEFWKAAGGPEAAAAIAQLEATQMELKQTSKTAILTADQINQQWAGGIADSFGQMAEALANGENGFKSLGQAFLKFAGDFLIQIGKMIIQQTMLNALQGMGGAGTGGFGGMILGALGKVTTGVFHTGKSAGAAGNGGSRSVPASIFAGAPRFHQGKLPGLRQGEMAAIIEQEEEVLTASHPRHAKNFAKMMGENQGSGSGAGNATIVNAFDAESFLQAGLSSPSGKKLFMNYVKANKGMIKGALGA